MSRFVKPCSHFEYVGNEQSLEKVFVQLRLLPDLSVQREER